MSEIVNNKVTDPVVVSISCITYNHAPYIRQCLDGFMMQQTNFAFEVLIHDDASTDGTTEIIKEYEAKYPDIIKPIYEEENQWVKGRRGSAVFNFPRAKGKYIALCEGDDYWTDPLKLQKQVDFLEKNPEYVMCSHRYDFYDQSNNTFYYNSDDKSRPYTLEFLLDGGWLFQPLTVVFRRTGFESSRYSECRYGVDVVLFYFLLQQGPGYYLSDNMAVYRLHNNGVWSAIDGYSKMSQEYKVRLAIYEVDSSDNAARFIRTQFIKNVGRKFFLRNFIKVLRAVIIVYRHFGVKTALKIICMKILLGKSIKVE